MPGLPHPSHKMPTLYVFFLKFWTPQTLRKICAETNKYVVEINPQSKYTPKKLRDSETWVAFHLPELRIFFVIYLYMEIKIKPNVWCYGKKSYEFLCYPVKSFVTT